MHFLELEFALVKTHSSQLTIKEALTGYLEVFPDELNQLKRKREADPYS